MNTDFPLFNQLFQSVKDNNPPPLTDLEKTMIVQTIKSLNDQEHEILYIVMRIYQLKHEHINTQYILPYNGKHQKKGIKFELDQLPEQLQLIIHEFIKLH